jgi:hypothetical protein
MGPFAPCLASDRVVGRIGETDCEELGSGFLAQPINAVTSLSYVAAGLIVLAIAWRRRGRPDVPTVVFAVLLAAVGLGSVAFHGPQPEGSRFLHDAPILLTVLFVLSYDLALLSSRIRRWWVAFSAVAVVAVIVSLVSPDAGVALTGVTIFAVAGAELLVHRRRLRPAAVGTQRRRYVVVLGVVAVAVATWLLGRTESPACDPDGVLQLHGLWHALSAAVFVTWWWLAIGAEQTRTSPEGVERSYGSMVG